MTGRTRQQIIDDATARIHEVVAWAAAEIDRLADEAEAATGVRVHPPSPLHPDYQRGVPVLHVVRETPPAPE